MTHFCGYDLTLLALFVGCVWVVWTEVQRYRKGE